MANGYFQFKQFTVRQQHCAMKVGTDGTLLGAWAKASAGPCRVLDVGTGTGLIALMMAQRYPEALAVAIDIDEKAVFQAQENVTASPFADRIQVLEADVQTFADSEKFDSIVCNPPFFEDSLVCPDPQRTEARHTVRWVIVSSWNLLSDYSKTPDDFQSSFLPTAVLVWRAKHTSEGSSSAVSAAFRPHPRKRQSVT